MATLQDITEQLQKAVGADSGLGKTLKFDFKGDGFIFVDGALYTISKRNLLYLSLLILVNIFYTEKVCLKLVHFQRHFHFPYLFSPVFLYL